VNAGSNASGFYDVQVSSAGAAGLGFTPKPGKASVVSTN
jgi:hypothetical protein